MEFTSGISLARIEKLDQNEQKKKNIGMLLAAFIGSSILVLGFLISSQVTRTTHSTSSQFTQESHSGCGSNCSCGISCRCH